MSQQRAVLVLTVLLVVAVTLIYNGISSFRDYSDKADAESYHRGFAPCQVQGNANDTRMTKYGPVCR